eukprot:gnl/TRDRNA2_/TRDRNA2_48282_c0_seq1.p1 gnl/TRDRNA2_/TRDRNA2_48282_c0~~gnl/TRDRNA2_/TRDRNA2_48282_c0_seq1.p1  ORF type:complete len:324 (+),score=39.93 gnl/TRDRNA2_/TRDRNA2_48282_c0_seq1:74-1045(+)
MSALALLASLLCGVCSLNASETQTCSDNCQASDEMSLLRVHTGDGAIASLSEPFHVHGGITMRSIDTVRQATLKRGVFSELLHHNENHTVHECPPPACDEHRNPNSSNPRSSEVFEPSGKKVVDLWPASIQGTSPAHYDGHYYVVAATDDNGLWRGTIKRNIQQFWETHASGDMSVIRSMWQTSDEYNAPWVTLSSGFARKRKAEWCDGLHKHKYGCSTLWHVGECRGSTVLVVYNDFRDVHGNEVLWQGGYDFPDECLKTIQKAIVDKGMSEFQVVRNNLDRSRKAEDFVQPEQLDEASYSQVKSPVKTISKKSSGKKHRHS